MKSGHLLDLRRGVIRDLDRPIEVLRSATPLLRPSYFDQAAVNEFSQVIADGIERLFDELGDFRGASLALCEGDKDFDPGRMTDRVCDQFLYRLPSLASAFGHRRRHSQTPLIRLIRAFSESRA